MDAFFLPYEHPIFIDVRVPTARWNAGQIGGAKKGAEMGASSSLLILLAYCCADRVLCFFARIAEV